jgi:hypothetical protein
MTSSGEGRFLLPTLLQAAVASAKRHAAADAKRALQQIDVRSDFMTSVPRSDRGRGDEAPPSQIS